MKHQSYDARLAKEKDIFEHCKNVHDLPEIFHYWSEKYIKPKVEEFGFTCANDMFDRWLARRCQSSQSTQRFVSIGAGNCDLEIELAGRLQRQGHSNFIIDCLDLNPAMLERGVAAAAKDGLAGFINPVQADANAWQPKHEYDAVIAIQALHHIVNLESLFDGIRHCLQPEGSFLISDIIGRNGHQHWPEALEIVHEFWRQLPPSYRFNRQLQRYEELYENWDCSQESFEGIRSQEILPLLLERFHFQIFICFSNVITPFISRGFGYNFDAKTEWDCAFVDRVHQRDELEIASGRITPVQMLAIASISTRVPTAFHAPLSPQFCVRRTPVATEHPSCEADAECPKPRQGPYDHSWPHSPPREIEIACHRLMECQARYQERAAWSVRLRDDLEQATARVQELEKEREKELEKEIKLEKELEKKIKDLERLGWAVPLDRRFHHSLSLAVKGVQRLRHNLRSSKQQPV
jgi:SAM-dependent methyltransferase